MSTNYDDHIEFLSIKVEDGPLTSKLQLIEVGSEVLIKPKCTGSLVIDYLKPTKNLVMLSTGTGIAPFMSICRDFETYEKYDNIFLFHTVREKNELAYRPELALLETDLPFMYMQCNQRAVQEMMVRFWDYIDEGKRFTLGRDSVMVCGSTDLNKQCRAMFKEQGWIEGNVGEAGDFMLERAFVD